MSDAGDVTDVHVRRTGGFIGRAVEGSLDLAGDDGRCEEVRRLVARIDLSAARGGLPHPDMYSYAFTVGQTTVTVPEHHLTPDLRRLAELVLPDPTR